MYWRPENPDLPEVSKPVSSLLAFVDGINISLPPVKARGIYDPCFPAVSDMFDELNLYRCQ